MDHDRHYSQHQQFLHVLIGHGSHPNNPREQRRAVLWRERMKREFHLQGLLRAFHYSCASVPVVTRLPRGT
jgi:hypothetical protein